MIIGTVRRYVLAGTAKNDCHFDFPFDVVTPVRQDDVITVANDCSASWLQEQVGYASIFLTLTSLSRPLFVGAALTSMRIKVYRRVHKFARILNRGHDVY